MIARLSILAIASFLLTQSAFPADATRPLGKAGKAAAPSSEIRISRDRQLAQEHLEKARRLESAGQFAAAEQHYLSALGNAPSNPEILLSLARLSRQAGRPGDARNWAVRARRSQADDPSTIAASLAYLPATEAQELLEQALRQYPDSAALQFQQGNRQAERGRWQEAANAYQTAANLAPEQADLWFNAAVALEHLAQRSRAIALYRRALATAEHTPSAFDKALAAQHLRQLEEEK